MHITSYYMYLDVTCSISLIHFFSFGPMAGVPTQTIYFLYDLYDFVYQSYQIVSYIFPQGSRLTCWPSFREGLRWFELLWTAGVIHKSHESSRVVSQPKVLPFSRIRVGTKPICLQLIHWWRVFIGATSRAAILRRQNASTTMCLSQKSSAVLTIK